MNLFDKVFVLTMLVINSRIHSAALKRIVYGNGLVHKKKQNDVKQREEFLIEFFRNSFPNY